MPKIPSSLTGTAGEHFVVYQLSCLGLVATLPRAGTKGVDILVTNTQGSKSLTIQVKTTDYAVRKRGKKKVPTELQFPLGRKSAKLNNANLFFAFFDLRSLEKLNEQPDVYVVPSKVVHGWCKSWMDKVKLVRLHRRIEEMEPYKNNWNPVVTCLQS